MTVPHALRTAISAAYHALAPALRPRGFMGRFRAARAARDGAEWDPPEAVWARQRDRINALLETARTHVPYYRRLAAVGRIPPHIERPEDLAEAPILTKAIIRAEGRDLLAENFPPERLHATATGGSTGEPLHFWNDADAVLAANAGEAWALSVAGVGLADPVAYLWGAARFERAMGRDLKDHLVQLLNNRCVVDCFHMKRDDLAAAHRRFTRFGPAALLGYSSALVELARYLKTEGRRPSYPDRAVISAAEVLDDVSREVLEETFGGPVFDRYGSREMGLIAMECDRHRGLHVDAENVFVELVEAPDAPGLSRIVVTRLNQFSMPFLRYDSGDLAEGPLETCPCGRGYAVLKRVVGRVTETIRFPDGGSLPGEIFPHLFKDCGILSYRVVQAEDYAVDVELVRTPDQTEAQDATLRRIVREHLGKDVPVTFRYAEAIERSRTGKLLPVSSHAPRDGGSR